MSEALQRQAQGQETPGYTGGVNTAPGFWTPEVQAVWKPLVQKLTRQGPPAGEGVHDTVVGHGLRLLHLRLRSHDSRYQGALARSGSARPEDAARRWEWHSLYEDRQVRLGLLSIRQGASVPLHDHPGITGFHLVVAGTAYIQQFDVRGHIGDPQVVELAPVSEALYEPGEVAAYRPDHGNVHGLQAETRYCAMLTVNTPLCHDADRAWYFPFDDLVGCNETVFAERVPFSFCAGRGNYAKTLSQGEGGAP